MMVLIVSLVLRISSQAKRKPTYSLSLSQATFILLKTYNELVSYRLADFSSDTYPAETLTNLLERIQYKVDRIAGKSDYEVPDPVYRAG